MPVPDRDYRALENAAAISGEVHVDAKRYEAFYESVINEGGFTAIWLWIAWIADAFTDAENELCKSEGRDPDDFWNEHNWIDAIQTTANTFLNDGFSLSDHNGMKEQIKQIIISET